MNRFSQFLMQAPLIKDYARGRKPARVTGSACPICGDKMRLPGWCPGTGMNGGHLCCRRHIQVSGLCKTHHDAARDFAQSQTPPTTPPAHPFAPPAPLVQQPVQTPANFQGQVTADATELLTRLRTAAAPEGAATADAIADLILQ